jgi:GNAT superfamily N-acetyltransferase
MTPHDAPTLVRRAGPADAPVLARLRFDFRAEIDPPVEAEAEFLERCRRWMVSRLESRGTWRCWVAEDGNTLLGMSWLQLLEKIPNPVGEPELHGYVSSLYVRSTSRGSGIGSALLAACLEECESFGADAVFLWPTPRSRPLYERHGFALRDDLLERRLDRRPASSRR